MAHLGMDGFAIVAIAREQAQTTVETTEVRISSHISLEGLGRIDESITLRINVVVAGADAAGELDVIPPDMLPTGNESREQSQVEARLLAIRREIVDRASRARLGDTVEFTVRVPTGQPEGAVEKLLAEAVPEIQQAIAERIPQAKRELDAIMGEVRCEVRERLSDPDAIRDALSLVADGIAVAGFTYQAILLIVDMIRKKRFERASGSLSRLADEQTSALIRFFKHTSRARIAEISAATKIPRQRVIYFMKGLGFEHDPPCFWHPPTIEEEVSRRAIKAYRVQWLKSRIGIYILKLLVGITAAVFAIHVIATDLSLRGFLVVAALLLLASLIITLFPHYPGRR